MSKRRDHLLFTSRALSKCFFLGLTVSSGTHAPSTLLNREISSISTCSLSFFFYQLTIHSRALQLPVGHELQAADKKIRQLNVMCFHGRLSTWRTNVWRRHIHEQDRTRWVPVHPPWIYAFGVVDHACTRSSSIRFYFSAVFLWVSWNRKWHKSVIRNDTKSVTSVQNSNTYVFCFSLIADRVRLFVNR